LLELINDWLSIARMNGGQIVDNLKPTSLNEVLTKIVDFLQSIAIEKDVSLKIMPPSEDDVVLGDPESLEQVFVNLISNAIEYNKPDGEVIVSIKDRWDSVQVDVKDTGVGIGSEHLPRIFDQFYQIDRSKRKGDKGSGLGLAIAKKVVEAHNGSIDVSSEPGVGSVFSVHLRKPD
jgi:two-component system phosphate regulon sensor histidine kinase PhoR